MLPFMTGFTRPRNGARRRLAGCGGIYPTEDTARAAWKAGELFVMDDETGTVVAAARINQEQVSAYDEADWLNRLPLPAH